MKPRDLHYCEHGASTKNARPTMCEFEKKESGISFLEKALKNKIKSSKDSHFCKVQQNSRQGVGTIPWILLNVAISCIQTSYN